MQFKPVPLHTGEEVDYMCALKQELRASSKNLPFYIKAARTKTGKTGRGYVWVIHWCIKSGQS